MTERDEPRPDGVHLHAEVSDHGRATLAGRDVHIHYGEGAGAVRRVEGEAVAGQCPYPGLAAYTAEQAGWFFGRDALSAELAERLAERLRTGGPLVVLGPSGAGKSSLLRAGLLPAISRRGVLPVPGSRHWPQILLTPTARPMTALHDAFARESPDGAAPPGDWFGAVAARLSSHTPGTRAVVVVDQFEEVFTLCDDEAERREFLAALDRVAAADAPGGPLGLVVYGMRMDAYPRCVDHPSLRAALRDGQVIVGPMTRTELEQAMVLPARAAGLEMEPGLVEILLGELGAAEGEYEAGRLPLLAHALRATWQQRHGHVLTIEGYRATGRIRLAVARTAERVYEALSDAGRAAAQALFLRLVKIGEDIDDTRRSATRAQLLRDGADPVAAGEALDAYTHSRLLTLERETVTITHEVLLRAWPRLRGWIDHDRAGHLLRQELEHSAAAWEREGRDGGQLLRGGRLEAVRARPALIGTLPASARALYEASARHHRRTLRIRRAVVALLCALTATALAAAGYAFRQRADVQSELDQVIFDNLLAGSQQLNANAQPALAGQLDLVALGLRQDRDVRSQDPDLFASLVNAAGTRFHLPPGIVYAGDNSANVTVAFSPTAPLLAVAADNVSAALELWSVADPAHPRLISTPFSLDTNGAGPIFASIAFSPDGRTLVCMLASGDILWWHIDNPAKPARIHPDIADPTCVPARNPVAICDDNGPVGYVGPNTVAAVESTPDGMALTMRLYSLDDSTSTPRAVATPAGAPLSLNGTTMLATDPRAHLLMAYGGGLPVQLWNVSDPRHPRLIPTPAFTTLTAGSSIGSAVLNPATHVLAIALEDASGNVQLWNLAAPAAPRMTGVVPAGLDGQRLISISRDGRTLAVIGPYGLQLWNITAPALPVAVGQPMNRAATAHTLDVDAGGDLLATGSDLGVITLWDLDASHDIAQLCRQAPLTRTEWRRYVPQLPYQRHPTACT